MADVIGVLNSGSSSIKYSIFSIDGADLRPSVYGQIEGIFTSPRFVAKSDGEIKAEKSWGEGVNLGHSDATAYLFGFLRDEIANDHLIGVGHRVAHGGVNYRHPVRLDADVLQTLEGLIPLAPLHQPYNLAPIRVVSERAPELPQVACFDTQFHTTNSELAQMFAIPAKLQDAGLRRYGFHGISYEYIASALPGYDIKAAGGRTVVLHLGSGASMCAMHDRRSVATTMGFSSAEGLPMGTRCGSIVPGVLLFLMDNYGMDARAIEKLIYKESGLLGVSGISNDMRVLQESTAPRAKLAIDLFVYRVRLELGSLTAALGGLDAIVFTAGIGEKAPAIRERICRDAAWLGIEFDAEANAAGGPRISTLKSPVAAWVIPTNEELIIARGTQRVINAS